MDDATEDNGSRRRIPPDRVAGDGTVPVRVHTDPFDTPLSEESASSLPWFAWGFVIACIPAVVAVFTPWFHTAPSAGGLGHARTYWAWTEHYKGYWGALVPLFLAYHDLKWLRALRGGPLPPRWGDSASGRAPWLAAAAYSALAGAGALVYFGVRAALVTRSETFYRTTYRGSWPSATAAHVTVTYPMRLGVGGWCLLVTGAVTVAAGLAGMFLGRHAQS